MKSRGRVPNTGGWSTVAVSMSGSLTSMPNTALPRDLVQVVEPMGGAADNLEVPGIFQGHPLRKGQGRGKVQQLPVAQGAP